jgi:hypothetical protein
MVVNLEEELPLRVELDLFVTRVSRWEIRSMSRRRGSEESGVA